MSLPSAILATGEVSALACPTSRVCYGVLALTSGRWKNVVRSAVILSTNAGASWTTINIGTNSGRPFQSVACSSAASCLYVGQVQGYSDSLKSFTREFFAMSTTRSGGLCRPVASALFANSRMGALTTSSPALSYNGQSWALLGQFPSGSLSATNVATSPDTGAHWAIVAPLPSTLAAGDISAAGTRWVVVGMNQSGGPAIDTWG